MIKKGKQLYILPAIIVAVVAVVSGCASMGRPEGGPRDVTPPVYVSSTPGMSQTSVRPKRVNITFDENIQLDDAFNKVIVSPVQLQSPQVTSNGRTVTVDFRDTLISDATYTIDFGDAIKDLNEGNVLDGFSFDFSTGKEIDTLRISGLLLEARTLEPAQGMLVGVYSDLDDSAFTTKPLERVSRTNQLGQFTIRNLKPGNYRVFAINDINRDYKWDRSEDFAFFDTIVSPSVIDIEVTDTLLSASGQDSLVTRGGIKFLPNDLFLTWTNENYRAQYLKDYRRDNRRKFTLILGAPTDSLPGVKLLDGRDIAELAIIEPSPENDSITYWITDKDILSADSLKLAVTYQKPDSLDRLVWLTDTLNFNVPRTVIAEEKRIAEKAADSTFRPEPLILRQENKSETIEIYDLAAFSSPTPIDTLISGKIKIEHQVDTVWERVRDAEFIIDTVAPLHKRILSGNFVPGELYRVTIDTLAVTDIYGLGSKPFSFNFKLKPKEEYGEIQLNIKSVQTDVDLSEIPMVVELLNGQDKVVSSVNVLNNTAKFSNITPGTYYARLFVDSDKDGKYTPGEYSSHRQPEMTFYLPKALTLKKNWTIIQEWVVDELPADLQKPSKIKQNKPKPKAGELPQSDESEEDEELPFGVNPFDDRRNDRKNNRNLNNYNTGGFGSLSGGFSNSLRR